MGEEKKKWGDENLFITGKIHIYSKEDKERQREYETSKVSKSDVE